MINGHTECETDCFPFYSLFEFDVLNFKKNMYIFLSKRGQCAHSIHLRVFAARGKEKIYSISHDKNDFPTNFNMD